MGAVESREIFTIVDGRNVPAHGYACSTCGQVYSLDMIGGPDPSHERYEGHLKFCKDQADRCCRCHECGKVERGITGTCARCDELRDRKQLESATVVPDYVGWVYSDEIDENLGHSGHFESADALIDYCQANHIPVPDRAYCCNALPFSEVMLGTDYLMERIADEMGEAISDGVVGLKELDAAFDAFTRANSDLVSYYPDYERCVLLGPCAAERAICERCAHKWVAVHPCCERIECPVCHHLTPAREQGAAPLPGTA